MNSHPNNSTKLTKDFDILATQTLDDLLDDEDKTERNPTIFDQEFIEKTERNSINNYQEFIDKSATIDPK